MRKIFSVLLFLVTYILSFPTYSLNLEAAGRLDEVQAWINAEQTRLSFALSGLSREVPYRVQLNPEQPQQLWVDLGNIQMPSRVQLPNSTDAWIKKINVILRPQGIRLVLELKMAVKIAHWLEVRQGQGQQVVVALSALPASSASKPLPVSAKAPGKPGNQSASVIVTAKKSVSANAMKPEAQTSVKARSARLRSVVVAIDAGHGGKDPGAIGHEGAQEKVVVLAIAKQLQKLLNRQRGVRAVLTREDDTFISLSERVEKARRLKADVFVSIHADSAPNGEAEGASVYTLSRKGASSELASWLADRENAADLAGGLKLDNKEDDVAALILDLSMRGKMKESTKLAAAILTHLQGQSKLHQVQVQQAGFRVLKSPDMTAILVETAFLSNPEDAKRLSNRQHQAKLAKAITKGIYAYLVENPLPETILTQVAKTASW